MAKPGTVDGSWFDLWVFLSATVTMALGVSTGLLSIVGWPSWCSTPLRQYIFLGVVLVLGMAANILAQYLVGCCRTRSARRVEARKRLDELVRHKPVKPYGKDAPSLEARACIMKPYRLKPKAWWDSTAPNGLLPAPKLYIVASSSSMDGAHDGNIAWAKGNGCVGLLWQTRMDCVSADLRDVPLGKVGAGQQDVVDFRLTPTQAERTKHLKCIVAVAIYRGEGTDQRLESFVCIDSPVDAAVENWLTHNGDVKPDVKKALQAVGCSIASDRLV